jgi:outer membrane protein insertion porin family
VRSARSLALTALLAVAALPRVVAAAQEGLGLPLQAVRFECDAWIDEVGLRARLPLRRGEPVTDEQIAASLRALEQANIFRAMSVDVQARDGGAVVIFHLKRKRIITDVSVTGYDALRWREVFRLVRLRTGNFYDPAAVTAARERLQTRYQRVGFPHAEVRSQVVKRPGEVDIRFTIDEGEPLQIAAVVVTGDTGVPAEQLQRSLRKLVGTARRRDAARDGERILLRQLREAGYYDAEIDSDWVASDDDVSGVLWFTVEAGPRSEIEIVGNESRSREQLLGLMDLSTRLIVTDGTWRELARRMTRAYQDGGYYRATVKVEFVEGNPRRIIFTVDQGRPYAVRRLRFVGNQQLASDRLRDQMNTQPARLLPWPRSGAFVRPVFDEDLRRLWFYYRTEGFADAEIVDAPVAVDDETGAIDITVVIDEGPRTIVETVHAPDVGSPPGGLTLQLAPGQPLLPAVLDADTAAIRAALRRQGYTDAAVEPVVARRVSGDVAPADVDWTITRGLRRDIGQIVVQGNVETRDAVIERQLPFKTGDPLDLDVLQRGQDRLYQLGTYRSVAVQPLGEPAEEQDVSVQVAPRPPGSVQWGAGYNTRDGITGFGEISYDNVARSARRIALHAQGSVVPDDASQTQFLTTLSYRDPQFLRSSWLWTSALVGERSTKTIDQYSILRGSFVNVLSAEVIPRVKVGAELQVEYADTFNVKPISFREEDEGTSYTTAPSVFFVFDGRNDPFMPTSGVLDSVRVRYAPPGLSSVQFAKFNLQHSQAIPLTPWLSFVYTGNLAYGHALSGAEVLPIRERYFLGGSTTVRGYAENSLGPVDPFGNVIGGDLAMVLSLELRVPIFRQLSAAVFNDNGGLFLTQCDSECEQQHGVHNNSFVLSNFRHSIGPGLRYMTPVGPISLDYGFKLDRRPGESIGEVAFSISGTF